MHLISGIANQWQGLCRKPPAVPVLQTDIPHESAYEVIPDGGGREGRSGSIRRGIGAAFSGMRILNGNRQLFWFPFLAGVVLAGDMIIQAVFFSIDRIVKTGMMVSYARDFLLEFVTLFFLVYLLAALVLCISTGKDNTASFYEGLIQAKKFLKLIMVWALVLAFTSMLLLFLWCHFFSWLPPDLRFLNMFGPFSFITSTIIQFPFNWTLDWDMLTEFPGYGGRSPLLWIYPFAFMDTFPISAINLFLFILTPFVVPLIVLGQKGIAEAVTGSVDLMKKYWIEVVSCTVFLGTIMTGVFLMYVLVQAASGMVSPFETVTCHPPGTWMVLGFLYDIALVIFAFVMATVGGIAALDLYTSAKNGQMHGSPKPAPHG